MNYCMVQDKSGCRLVLLVDGVMAAVMSEYTGRVEMKREAAQFVLREGARLFCKKEDTLGRLGAIVEVPIVELMRYAK